MSPPKTEGRGHQLFGQHLGFEQHVGDGVLFQNLANLIQQRIGQEIAVNLVALLGYQCQQRPDRMMLKFAVPFGQMGEGDLLTYSGFRGVLVNAAQRTRVDLHWGLHGLRHGFGMYATEHGLDTTHLQRILRTSPLKTRRYTPMPATNP